MADLDCASFGFEETGIPLLDELLQSIILGARLEPNTEDWGFEDNEFGTSVAEDIQAAADNLADWIRNN